MLNWLRGVWNTITGIPGDIVNWFMSIITAVESYLESLIQDIWNFIGWIQSLINYLFNEAWNFINTVWGWVNYVIDRLIPDVISWAWGELQYLAGLVDGAYRWVIQQIDAVTLWAERYISDLINWVIHNIWDPLYSSISGVISWVTHEGAFILDLLTHPDKLATLIGRYLLGAWVYLLRHYAAPIGRWLVRSMLAAGSDVAAIIEDMITAIL